MTLRRELIELHVTAVLDDVMRWADAHESNRDEIRTQLADAFLNAQSSDGDGHGDGFLVAMFLYRQRGWDGANAELVRILDWSAPARARRFGELVKEAGMVPRLEAL